MLTTGRPLIRIRLMGGPGMMFGQTPRTAAIGSG